MSQSVEIYRFKLRKSTCYSTKYILGQATFTRQVKKELCYFWQELFSVERSFVLCALSQIWNIDKHVVRDKLTFLRFLTEIVFPIHLQNAKYIVLTQTPLQLGKMGNT